MLICVHVNDNFCVDDFEKGLKYSIVFPIVGNCFEFSLTPFAAIER